MSKTAALIPIGIALASGGLPILLAENPPFLPWVAPAMIFVGVALVLAGAIWPFVKRNTNDKTPAAMVDNNGGQVSVTRDNIRVGTIQGDIVSGHQRNVNVTAEGGRQANVGGPNIQSSAVEGGVVTANADVVNIYQQTPAVSTSDTQPSYWRGRPLSLGDNFFGRASVLDDISKAFTENNKIVVLSGGAGFGKSQLAAEYSHDPKRNGFWTAAGDTAEQTLVALAPDLRVEIGDRPPGDVARDVTEKLTALPSDTLWIVDNITTLRMVGELAPLAGSVPLLFTTRDGNAGHLPTFAKFLPLAVLDNNAAVELLCSRSSTDKADACLPKIAETVGYLPMALEMLAPRLKWEHTPESLLKELRTVPNPIQLRAFQTALGHAAIAREEGVFATIAGTLNALPDDARADIPPLGYIADAPVSRELLAALTGRDGDGLTELVRLCMERSVLSVPDEGFRLHALTAAAIAATNEEGAVTLAVARCNRRLIAIVKTDHGALRREVTHHTHIRAAGKSSLEEDQNDLLWLSNNLANTYGALGRYDDALKLDQETLEIRERVLGSEHPSTLSSRNGLANTYGALGRYEEALELDQETLEIRERVLGPEHPDTLGIRSNLANDYRALGRNDEALELDQGTLEIMEQVLGPEHPDTLASRNGLAITYRALGRNDEALELDQETLEIRERLLGPEHPDTLTSRSNLAVDYQQLDRYDEALKLDQETLEIRERVLGSEHPSTLGSRNNLANTYRALGRYEEADALEAQLDSDEG